MPWVVLLVILLAVADPAFLKALAIVFMLIFAHIGLLVWASYSQIEYEKRQKG